MRITHLRLKNLNSLAGEWSVNFSHPAYTTEGLFAITGSTGAGKSTLLDAICLALYGRTPRLESISQSANDIMSRHTGECWAEVEFTTAHGHFRSRWSQRRAHGKPGNNLQKPQHELANAQTGELLATKIKEVAKDIEQLTGMDFKRFTRAILLAQGGFAAFLHADAGERAALLEQITGTDVYGGISCYVHQRAMAERASVENLREVIRSKQVLTDIERESKNKELDATTTHEATLAAAVQTTQHALTWLKNLEQTQQSLQDNTARLKAWHEQAAVFAPERARLDAAMRALGVEGDYATLAALRQEQHAAATQLEEEAKLLPNDDRLLHTAQTAECQAAAVVDSVREMQRKAEPLLQRVRELDTRYEEKKRALYAATEAHTAAQALGNDLEKARQADEATASATRKRLETLVKDIADTSGDDSLIEALPLLHSRVTALQTIYDEVRANEQAVLMAQGKSLVAERAMQVEKNALHTAQQAVDKAEIELRAHEERLTRCLNGRHLSAWREEQSLLAERANAGQRLHDAVQERDKTLLERDELHKAEAALHARRATLEAEKPLATAQRDAAMREAALREENALLYERIANLETLRRTLIDAVACPLCGSTEHPFAKGNIPEPTAARIQWEQAKAAMQTAHNTCQRLEAQLETLCREQQAIKVTLQRLEANLAARHNAVHIQAAALELCAETLTLDAVATFCQTTAAALRTVRERTREAEALDTTVRKHQQALTTLRDARARAESAMERANQNVTHAHTEATRLLQEGTTLHQREADSRALLVEDIAPFVTLDATMLSPQKAAQALDTLNARRLHRQQILKAHAEQDKQLAECSARLQQRTERCTAHVAECERCRQAETAARTEAITVQQVRATILQELAFVGCTGTDIASYENHIKSVYTQSEEVLAAARLQTAQAAQCHTARLERVDTLRRYIAQRAATIETQTAQVAQRCLEQGFANEAAFFAARMETLPREALAMRARELDEAHAALQATSAELTKRLGELQSAPATTEAYSTVAERATALEAEQREQLQTIGALRQVLRTDAQAREAQRTHLEQLEVQQREAQRWDRLRDLIGSADGKKFRTFAQGLTFERVVAHANAELRKMTDRYILERMPEQPLELNVVDAYQAGMARTTKNLSGGESFLVSLALALGLSRMSSRNVSVDSLFLDEGFGTLDEDTLETALDTLASLRQEGKLIGVISHVQALKDRVPTQIEVKPMDGGRSRLFGPGCSVTTT